MQRGLDANVLIRILVDGDDEQLVRARQLLREPRMLFVSMTVLSETEWALRARFRYGRDVVNDRFLGLLRLPNVVVDDRSVLKCALSAHRAGLDVADAVHLHSCPDCDELLTFDKKFIKGARKVANNPIVREP